MNDDTGVRLVRIGANHHGQRIDNYLLRELKGVPKSRVYRILRKGEVRVNKGRVRPDYRLQQGDSLRLPPLRTAERAAGEQGADGVPGGLRERLRQALLYEDDTLLVIDKPAGLAVHKGSGLQYGLIETLRLLRPEAGFLELAHRLDRDTSGCLLLAKTPEALRGLQRALQGEAAEKRYLALTCGRWQHGRRDIDAPLRKNTLRGGERVVTVAADGKAALSRFRPVSVGARASLLDVAIVTGRTHQIRVHAAYAGHPVAGDRKYGDAGCNARLAEAGLRRLFLHAHSVTLPLGGRELTFSAPLPPELAGVLERLRLD